MTPPENYNKAVETLQARLKEAAETWAKAAVAVADEHAIERHLHNARGAREVYKKEYQEILNDLRELRDAVHPPHYVNLPGADVPPVGEWGRPVFSMPGAVDVMGGIASPAPPGSMIRPSGASSVGHAVAHAHAIMNAAPEILRRIETETPRPWVPHSENK